MFTISIALVSVCFSAKACLQLVKNYLLERIAMNINISIGYGASKVLYDNVEISIEKGEINNIIGENGTGKSTFYKTIIGEIPPLAGEVPSDIQKNIAVISDYISLPQELQVLDVLNFIDNDNIVYMKDNFQNLTNIIFPLSPQKIKTLSTGQKRMLEIFVVLSSKKSILILDEACNGLDYKNRSFFLKNVKDLVRFNNVTIFHTSHNLEDVIDLGGHVYILDELSKVFRKYNGSMTIDALNLFLKKAI